jgi:hypothetical protein
MLNLATNLRESSRFLLGALAVALMLLVSSLFAIAAGFPGAHEEAVGRLRSAGPPIQAALGEGRNAHRRMNVLGRIAVTAAQSPDPEASAPPRAAEPSHQLTAIETPASTPDSPPAPTSEPPPPAPEPAPEPEPGPPAPEPPPPAPEPPPPAPEPPPAPSPESPPPPPQPAGQVLFKATFDSGIGGWSVQSLPGRISILSADPYEGSHAVRFEVRDGDVEPDTGSERSELSGPTFDEGQDLYIRDAVFVPSGSTYQGPWQIIHQLHEENWSGSPGMAVFLDSRPALKIGGGDGSPTFWTSTQLEKGRWYELVYRVKLSRDPGTGFVEVWLDGIQQTLDNGQTRAYGQTIQAAQTYLKVGIYRSASSIGTSIVEHDSIAVGTSLATVMGA